MNLVMIIALLLIGKYILKCDVKQLSTYKAKTNLMEPMTNAAKKALILFGILVLALMLPYFLPQEMALRTFLEKTLGSTVICILITGLALLLREGDKPFAEFRTLVFDGVAWNDIYAGMRIYNFQCTTSEELGIAAMMSTLVAPIKQ